MNALQNLQIELTDWRTSGRELRAVRTAVFVHEQRVPAEMEWDEFDASAEHVIARVDDQAVGTARLVTELAGGDKLGRVGRMAVLVEWRKHGIGAAMLARLIERARELNLEALYLHAQTHALAFYARHGFIAKGAQFSEVDIAHQSMRMRLRG